MMRRIFLILVVLIAAIFAASGCSPKVVPPSNNTTVIIRDSIVYRTDSVEVPVPYEVVRNVVPSVEEWQAETSVAEARCSLDTNLMVLRGELKNKKTALQGSVQVPEHFHAKDSVVIKEIPVPYPVEKTVYPKWLVIIAILGAVCLAAEVMRLFIK